MPRSSPLTDHPLTAAAKTHRPRRAESRESGSFMAQPRHSPIRLGRAVSGRTLPPARGGTNGRSGPANAALRTAGVNCRLGWNPDLAATAKQAAQPCQFPSFALVRVDYCGRKVSTPGTSDLIDDKVASDSHARQIKHVRVNNKPERRVKNLVPQDTTQPRISQCQEAEFRIARGGSSYVIAVPKASAGGIRLLRRVAGACHLNILILHNICRSSLADG
jgi:hypothetical protein